VKTNEIRISSGRQRKSYRDGVNPAPFVVLFHEDGSLNQIPKAIKPDWKRLATILRYVTEIYDRRAAGKLKWNEKINNAAQPAYQGLQSVNMVFKNKIK